MGNYFVVEIATTSKGTATAITKKETFNEATMLFHQVLASMMANKDVIGGICTILDETGRQMGQYTEYYSAE